MGNKFLSYSAGIVQCTASHYFIAFAVNISPPFKNLHFELCEIRSNLLSIRMQ